MRKSLFICAVLLFTLLSHMAFATDYKVLVYPESEEVSSYIESFFPTRYFDSGTLDLINRQRDQIVARALGENLHKAYQSEDPVKVMRAREEVEKIPVTEDSTSDFNVVMLSPKGLDYDAGAMIAGDINLLDYVCQSMEAQLLVMPVKETLSGFRHMSIYIYRYGSEEVELVFESLSGDSDSFSVSCALKLAPLFMDKSPALVRLLNLVTSSTVTVDGRSKGIADSCVITTEGMHQFLISAQGHQSRSISVYLEGGKLSEFDSSLKALTFSELGLDSSPQAQVINDGIVIGTTPMVIENYSVPLSLRFAADGYSSKVVSVAEKRDSLFVSLKPKWMSAPELLKEKRNDFYASFVGSLLIFGVKVALSSFNDGTNAVLSSLDLVCNAALTISVADMVGSLIDYYRQTEYVAP